MGLLKTILPIVSVLNILLNLMVMLNPAGSSFASAGDVKGLEAHVESPFAAYLIFQLCAAGEDARKRRCRSAVPRLLCVSTAPPSYAAESCEQHELRKLCRGLRQV